VGSLSCWFLIFDVDGVDETEQMLKEFEGRIYLVNLSGKVLLRCGVVGGWVVMSKISCFFVWSSRCV
jgi:hypothetical protein